MYSFSLTLGPRLCPGPNGQTVDNEHEIARHENTSETDVKEQPAESIEQARASSVSVDAEVAPSSA